MAGSLLTRSDMLRLFDLLNADVYLEFIDSRVEPRHRTA
jgi:hypothetical protein